LTEQYYKQCSQMADRILSMRTKLVESIIQAGSTHDWSHVTEQIGMFAFTGESLPSFRRYLFILLYNSLFSCRPTGMSAEMCDQLTDDYAIYLTRDGRISIAGLNDGNLKYVAEAVHAVTDGKSITSN
jgi:aspartate aminotransferase